MIIKIILINAILFFGGFHESTTKIKKNEGGSYEVVKNTTYKGQALEPVFKVNYHNKITNTARYFLVIKTNSQIKNYFLADFLLVEKTSNGSHLIFYPTGWGAIKFINVDELKQTCKQVVEGEIHSEIME